MTISSQDYAFLSDMAYKRWEIGGQTDPAPSGAVYRVLETKSDEYGYYGIIFQSSSGELVVAHCGTEFETDMLRDLFEADGQMATLKLNQQKFSADHLVARARDFSLGDPRRPPVTVTGHSLGGSLAQITAAEFGLYGETFNAYGAAGQYGTPAGGTEVVNYIRVTDMVAAAGAHYGKVIAYATAEDFRIIVNDPSYFSPLANLPELLPDVTHAVTQFYGQNCIVTQENIDRYEESRFLYETYRAQILAVATAAPIVLEYTPATSSFYNALTQWLRRQYMQAEAQEALLGSSGVDVKVGAELADYIGGLEGADLLSGGGGDDLLKGGSGDDTLRGDSGNDHLFGDENDDYLSGGAGSDSLEGGGGFDTYKFHASDFQAGDNDTIVDSDGLGKITFNGKRGQVHLP